MGGLVHLGAIEVNAPEKVIVSEGAMRSPAGRERSLNQSPERGAGLRPALEFLHFSAIFYSSTYYTWGWRFRLPTRYVLPQKAPPLASRYHRGNLPVCYLAFGGLHPTDSTVAAVHCCAPIRWPGLPRHGPRGGQSRFRTGLAAGCPNSAGGG